MFPRRRRSHATNKRAESAAKHRARAPSRGTQAPKPTSSPSLSTIRPLPQPLHCLLVVGDHVPLSPTLACDRKRRNAHRETSRKGAVERESSTKTTELAFAVDHSAPAATPRLPTGGRRSCSPVADARMRPINAPSAPRNIAQGRRREGIEHSNQPARLRRRPFGPCRNP